MIYLDTHVVIWLFSGRVDLLTPKAMEAIENQDLLISPIVSLELQYLFEIGKISDQVPKILEDLSASIGLSLCDQPFDKIVVEAQKLHWTRDPFDRIITAQAGLRRSTLLTKDSTILEHYKRAIWN